MLQVESGDVLLPVPDAVEKAVGYRPSPATCWRWAKKGIRGVRLETVRIGSLVKTTEAAVIAFVHAQSRDDAAAQGGEQLATVG